MNSTHQIDTGTLVYTVVDDFSSVYRAVITGIVTDELGGILDAPDLKITADRPNLAVRIASNGAFALTGYGEAIAYTVNLVISASGFRELKVAVPVPANATAAIPAPGIALRRKSVRLQGRVVADTAARAPIAGALVVSIDDPSSPPPAVHPLVLRSPLALPHAVHATIRNIVMNPTGNSQLNVDAPSGAGTLALSNRTGLVEGSVLQLSDQTHLEYAIVVPPVTGAGAGPVFLRDPLYSSFFAQAAVQFVNPITPGVAATLSQDADADDGVLLSSTALGGSTIEVEPGTAQVEYREIGAITDADGYYAIGGVGRTLQIYLQGSHAGFTPKGQEWPVQFDNPVNILDFRL